MFNLNPLLSLLWAFCSHLLSTDPLSTLIFPLLPLPIYPTRFFQSCSFLPCASPPPLALCLPRRHLALVYSSEPEEGGAREARSGESRLTAARLRAKVFGFAWTNDLRPCRPARSHTELLCCGEQQGVRLPSVGTIPQGWKQGWKQGWAV